MREVINLHIGQAGLQIADSCWQLMLNEHNLNLDGTSIEGKQLCDNSVMMIETNKGKYSPRALFIDTQPSVLDEMQKNQKKGFYNPSNMFNAKYQTGNLFGDGYRAVGSHKCEQIYQKIRKLAENCDFLQGFILTMALQGGTGSGLSSRIAQYELSESYQKITKVAVPIYGSPNTSSIPIAAYNEVLSFSSLLNSVGLTILLDNQALYRICSQKIGIQSPTFKEINAIIARMYSAFTIPLRFKNLYNQTFRQVTTNLVPYPRLQSVIPAMYPFQNQQLPSSYISNFSQSNMVEEVFDNQNMLLSCNRQHGYHLSNYLMFQGDVNAYQAQKMTNQFQDKRVIRNVDFIPNNYKIKTNQKFIGHLKSAGLGKIRKSVLCLTNGNFISENFTKVDLRFDLLYSKRAFMHWYIPTMQQGEFMQSRENMAALEKDYEYGWAEQEVYGYEQYAQY